MRIVVCTYVLRFQRRGYSDPRGGQLDPRKFRGWQIVTIAGWYRRNQTNSPIFPGCSPCLPSPRCLQGWVAETASETPDRLNGRTARIVVSNGAVKIFAHVSNAEVLTVPTLSMFPNFCPSTASSYVSHYSILVPASKTSRNCVMAHMTAYPLLTVLRLLRHTAQTRSPSFLSWTSPTQP